MLRYPGEPRERANPSKLGNMRISPKPHDPSMLSEPSSPHTPHKPTRYARASSFCEASDTDALSSTTISFSEAARPAMP